eukprot:jgi/Mesen1/7968/ME000422S07131
MGRLAGGAVTVTDGETVVYATACSEPDLGEPSDFLPLQVMYQERFSAAGRTAPWLVAATPGLACFLTPTAAGHRDEPLAALMAVTHWVASSRERAALATTRAVSDIPLTKSIAGVKVGLRDGHFVVGPTVADMEQSPLDMTIAGTADAVLMIEGYCNLLTEEKLLEAVDAGHVAIRRTCLALTEWAAVVGKPKQGGAVRTPPGDLAQRVQEVLGDDLEKTLRLRSKKERGAAGILMEQRLMAALTAEGQQLAAAAAASLKHKVEAEEEEWDKEEEGVVENGDVDEGEMYEAADIKRAYKELSSLTMRRLVVQEGVRSDGRGPTDIRQIEASCSILPRTHGSALFTRGETQALAVATLGGTEMGQRTDSLANESRDSKRFYLQAGARSSHACSLAALARSLSPPPPPQVWASLGSKYEAHLACAAMLTQRQGLCPSLASGVQYSFPPSSVGETGRTGGPSRREIGHGTLAERSIEPMLPDAELFPYTIRLESTITDMASVCGGCLALMDAGVPLRGPVAGVAMGLILDTAACGGSGEPLILSDILGSEDALGDMDFKVAGTEDGVTAFQMDIKVEGITIAVMEKALAQAKAGRCHILGEMAKCWPAPAQQLSVYAPLIRLIKVDTDKVAAVIGSGGKTIKAIVEDCGVESVDIEDDGIVKVVSKTKEGLDKACARIEGITMTPQVGKIYRNCLVKNITTFGAFVEIAPGKEVSDSHSTRLSPCKTLLQMSCAAVGLVHVSEFTTARIDKVEDFTKEGDRLDVKLLEINMKGQLRLSHKAVVLEERREKQKALELAAPEE